jgi:hypothetical protein
MIAVVECRTLCGLVTRWSSVPCETLACVDTYALAVVGTIVHSITREQIASTATPSRIAITNAVIQAPSVVVAKSITLARLRITYITTPTKVA